MRLLAVVVVSASATAKAATADEKDEGLILTIRKKCLTLGERRRTEKGKFHNTVSFWIEILIK